MAALKKIKIKTRAQHVWIRGVLVFGIVGPLFFNLVYFLLADEISKKSVVVSIIVSFITGYFWGVWTWQIAQKKEKKHGIERFV